MATARSIADDFEQLVQKTMQETNARVYMNGSPQEQSALRATAMRRIEAKQPGYRQLMVDRVNEAAQREKAEEAERRSKRMGSRRRENENVRVMREQEAAFQADRKAAAEKASRDAAVYGRDGSGLN